MRGARTGDRHAGSRRDPIAARALQGLSPSAFRRNAPARDDRDSVGVPPEAHAGRRTDDGPRRDDPGPDYAADKSSQVGDGRMSLLLVTHDLGVVARMPGKFASCMRASSSKRRMSGPFLRHRFILIRKACSTQFRPLAPGASVDASTLFQGCSEPGEAAARMPLRRPLSPRL